MSTVWTVTCKDCGNPVPYSDAARTSALERGHSPPERCGACRGQHRRDTSRLGAAYLDLEPGRPVPVTGLKAGRLGRISHPERPHTAQTTEPEPVGEDQFGIKDEHVCTLLEGLRTHQVAIVEAGTGSGKSTFLPWRLLVPPEPFPRDHLTRHGQIVVTQPRIDASTGIPEYVANRLHGSRAGPGLDIGYRNSKATDKTDAANKLVYLTDGTLVNMIRRGEMHTISTVVIDEAHERSLNIDLILALLRREMRNLPHLRLLIVSATLDPQTFTDFFAPDIDVLRCPMPSKTQHPVHERWRTEEPIPLRTWPRRMPDEVASRAVEVLRWMAHGHRPADIPDSVPAYQGDVLCFLPGKRPINNAIEEMQRLLAEDDEMAPLLPKIEILPLHSELPNRERRRPLDPKSRPQRVTWRVVVATNLAETSLTIDGVRHVVDSGLNNLTSWDPVTASAEMRPAPHSQAGLLQRRGRAGRNAPGVWHCLFTHEQFNDLDYATEPEISRSPLTAVILNAATAGVSDPQSLRWLPPGPVPVELARARADLLKLGAITDTGDPTTFGREINSARGEFSDSTILINADTAGCLVEAATVLALKAPNLRGRSLLRWETRWPAPAKIHVDDIHHVLLDGCADDVEVVCRVVSYWENQPPQERHAWCERHYVDHDFLTDLLAQRTTMLTGMQSKTKTEQVRPIDLVLLPRLRAVIAWSNPNAVYATARDDEGKLTLDPVETPRSDPELIQAMHDGARPTIDPRSHAYLQPPGHLVMLDRSRGTRWTSPLSDPETVQQGSICAAVDPALLKPTGSLLGILVDVLLGERHPEPVHLPGDRYLARLHGGAVWLLESLAPLPDETVTLGSDDEELPPDSDEIPVAAGSESDEADLSAFPEDVNFQPPAPPEPQPDVPELPAAELADWYDGEGTIDVRVAQVRDDILVVVPDRTEAELEALEAAHPVGTDFPVTVEETRTFPRDSRPLLLVRDTVTGQRLVLDGGRLGTGLRFTQTRQLQPNTVLELTAEGYDHERLIPHLGQTAATISALTHLALLGGAPRRPVGADADLVDAQEGKLWVQIATEDSSQPEPSTPPPLVFWVDSGRLPDLPDALVVGRTIRARLSWARHPTAWADVKDIDINWTQFPPGPWERRGDRLVLTGPPTVGDWRKIIEFCSALPDPADAARLRSSTAYAALRILSPRVEVIDEDAIKRMAEEGQTEALVTASDERGVTVKLPSGGTKRVAAGQLSWDGSQPGYEVGTVVPAYITSADPTSGDIRVELRDPAADPFLTIREGQIVTGTVTGRVGQADRDFLVEVAGTGIKGHLRGNNAPGVEVGEVLHARVTTVRTESRSVYLSCWLFDRTVPLPREAEELWNDNGKRDSRPLTQFLPDRVHIQVRDGDEPQARIYANDESAGQRACESIQRVFAGIVRHIAVPDFAPLTENQAELIRRFAPHAALATRRVRINGKAVCVAVVAADSDDTVTRVEASLRAAYPSQWVSEPFRRRGEEWKAAMAAVKQSGLGVWVTSERVESESRPPWFRVVLTGDADRVNKALAIMRDHLELPSVGSWREDEQICILERSQGA
ncbi:helicase-related protein [Streptomyces sp. V4I2]|uniref:helicase-related protein n=1 Tax=Streptomyces sp. V4I2 TaxID=3042280 RepID=UPI00277FDFBC|nr:helicase-related protein [Streptomyces sp. V4I2]MDQ1052052.1 HrpA-like RNA helicase [Streptomyces sp. V4I2]